MGSTRLGRWALLLALLLACAGEAEATLVSTLDGTGPGVIGPRWDESTFVDAWGSAQVMFEASPTYGQTFMAPDNAPFLQSIGFVIRNPLGNPSIRFRAYVYQWLNGTVGQAVFTSPVQTIPPAADWQAVLVGVPQLRLETDRQYVVLYTTVGAGNTQTVV
jgi:hypothetical protein